jgi:glycosyltransferase involved in cell wall biosynthesis
MAGVPVLCHVRNRLEEMPHLGRLHLRPVSHFAFVSKHTWAQFPLYVPPGKGTVIYDGVDSAPGDPASDALHAAAAAQVRAEFGFPDGAKLVGMVARVVPQKDYATMIAAASRVVHAHPEVRFLVVGDHSGTEISRAHYAEIRAILDRSGMTPWFVFTGYRRDVPGFLDAFDIAVLSTHHEGLPLVLLESMARARPTVATAVDGIPELIDGTNGLLHPHGDAEALAAHLLNLLDHPEAGARIGRAARQTVLEKFTTRQFTDCIVELYTRMLPG